MPEHRAMPTVALVGADGAGKSTVGRRLVTTLSVPVKYLYMGDNPQAADHVLPTKRWLNKLRRGRTDNPRRGGPPDPSRSDPRPSGALGRLRASAKAALRLTHHLADEWFRQALAWYYQRRGYVVVFDRHFFADYYAHHVAPAPTVRLSWSNRIHGLVLGHLYPKPDLIICLDAPAEVLYSRKREGTLETLERRRQDYFALQHRVRHFAVVDATRPLDDVAHDVATLIERLSRDGVTPS